MSDDDRKYVAESARSYGVSDMHESDAVYRMARYWHGDVPETVKVMVWTVEGYNGGQKWHVDADEVLRENKYEIPRDDFQNLLDTIKPIDIAVEDALVDNEVERF